MNRTQAGFTLIEVLVTLLILSVGLIGLAALQAKSLQYNQGSYLRSQANILAYDIIDRMRINRKRAQEGAYNLALDAATPSGSELHQVDLHEWIGLLSSTLPAGDGQVGCNSVSCEVSVAWTEADGNSYSFSYRTRI